MGFETWGTIAVTTAITVIGWLLIKLVTSFEKQIKENKDEIQKLQDQNKELDEKIDNLKVEILETLLGLKNVLNKNRE